MTRSSIVGWVVITYLTFGAVSHNESAEFEEELIGSTEGDTIAVSFMGLRRNTDGELDRAVIQFDNTTDDSAYEILINRYPLAQGYLAALTTSSEPISDPFFSIGGIENPRFDVNREATYMSEELLPGQTFEHEMLFRDFVQDPTFGGADQITIIVQFRAQYRKLGGGPVDRDETMGQISFTHFLRNVPAISKGPP